MTKTQYFKFITKLLFSKQKKWELQTGHTVQKAFISGGVQYYQMNDTFDTFVERGLEAYQVYEELLMRVGVDDLKNFILASKEARNANPIKLTDIFKLWDFLEERVNFVIPPRELIWKMASVKYFDANESPYKYDSVYAAKKIATWKANGDIEDFFLYQQLGNTISLPKLSKEIYLSLQEMITKIQQKQLELMNISGSLSEV